MPNVTATKYGKAGSTLVSSWTTARETGNFANNQETGANVTAVLAQRGSKNGINYRVTRSFLAFDLSAYAGQTISNLTLSFRQTTGTVAGGLVIAILKSTAQGSGSTFSDLTVSEFFTSIDFTTEYANFIPIISSANTNAAIQLTEAAMTDATSGSLRLALVQAQNDANDLQPSSDQIDNGNWNLDTSSSGFIPVLAFTATDWGSDINGVPVGTIQKINNVPINTIDEVNILDNTTENYFSFGIYDVEDHTTTWIKALINVLPANLAVGDTLYYQTNAGVVVLPNITEYIIIAGNPGYPSNCSGANSVLSTNSSGVITYFGCAT